MVYQKYNARVVWVKFHLTLSLGSLYNVMLFINKVDIFPMVEFYYLSAKKEKKIVSG